MPWRTMTCGSVDLLVPAEISFPLPVVIGHGLLALATLTLAVLAAADIGT
jgi:hypothetical protein